MTSDEFKKQLGRVSDDLCKEVRTRLGLQNGRTVRETQRDRKRPRRGWPPRATWIVLVAVWLIILVLWLTTPREVAMKTGPSLDEWLSEHPVPTQGDRFQIDFTFVINEM